MLQAKFKNMFIQLKHRSLAVYAAVRELTKEVYRVSTHLPGDERFNMVPQMRRPALSVKLNLAEGSTRKSEIERKRFYEIARGSLIEVDVAFDIASNLNYTTKEKLNQLGILMVRTFQLISKMIS